jgi:hypothetical protein
VLVRVERWQANNSNIMTNNAKALIKLANVFDLYDHQHYGYRFNKNNPKKSPINVIIQK